MTNRLSQTNSPYLLQHAKNPVNWYPWSPEAFEKAREQDRPIFLSIGYSACHWCHVMERESFQNPQIAEQLNRDFICIKVDREEHPEIDAYYMNICQILTGAGGWPLTIVMTPDKKAFFAGTYIPDKPRYGRPGLPLILEELVRLWRDQREGIRKSADEIAQTMQILNQPGTSIEIGSEIFDRAFSSIVDQHDEDSGGFGGSTKFPMTGYLSYLMRYALAFDEKLGLHIVDRALRAMHRSGLHDHVDGGFHRYCVDQEWILPHFEKMLYDQALLARVFTEGAMVLERPIYNAVAQRIFGFVNQNMTHPEGGFYTSIDADSPEGEGWYYTWTTEEFEKIFGPDSEDAIECFNLEPEGNFPEAKGRNVLYLHPKTSNPLYPVYCERLRLERQRRRVPDIDDKILTDWNSLMISALAVYLQYREETVPHEMIKRAMKFIRKHLSTSDGLLHSWRNGKASISGTLTDYAFWTAALIDSFEALQCPDDLAEAVVQAKRMIAKFWDPDEGGFHAQAKSENSVPYTQDGSDSAVPSAASLAITSLIRLSLLTGNEEFLRTAGQSLKFYSARITKSPPGYTGLLEAQAWLQHGCLVTVHGENEQAMSLLRTLRKRFRPWTMHVHLTRVSRKSLSEICPVVSTLPEEDGTASICQIGSCSPPVSDSEVLDQLLDRIESPGVRKRTDAD